MSKLWVEEGKKRETKIDFKEKKLKNSLQSCSCFSFEQELGYRLPLAGGII